jgi:hypothetical protein
MFEICIYMPGLWEGLKHVPLLIQAIKSNDVDSNVFSSIEVEINFKILRQKHTKKVKHSLS